MRVIGISLYAMILGEKVRSPQKRAARNKRFLNQWFENNCNESTGIRPMRCASWKKRFFNQWEKMTSAFERKCGYFDPLNPDDGPKDRKRRSNEEDVGDEYDYYNDELMFETNIFNSDYHQDQYDQYDNEDYWAYMNEYPHEFVDPDETLSDSTTDEETSVKRVLLQKDPRKISADPARALRQLTNAMKQFCKRYISRCGIEKNYGGHTKKIRNQYKNFAVVHQLIMDKERARAMKVADREARKNRF